jgi:mRNA degradation ribonuclease J1/J2
VLVDGNVLWDVGQSLLKDRQRLARDGVSTTVVTVDANLDILSGPDIITRGFIDGADPELILDEGKRRVVEVLDAAKGRGTKDLERIKAQIVEALSRYFGERTRRRPVQLVVIHQVQA